MVSKPKRRSPAEWLEARDWFVQGKVGDDGVRGYPTLDEVATKFGAHTVTVRKRSTKDGWLRHRNVHATRVAEERGAKVREKPAGDSAEFDANNLKIARALQGHVAKNIQKATKGNKVLDAKQIKELAGALSEVQKIGRLTFGEETSRTGINANVDFTGLTDEQLAALESIMGPLAGAGGDDAGDQGGTGAAPAEG